MQMAERLDPLQFRPNIVVAGFKAHSEDSWHCLNLLGADDPRPTIELMSCGPCARCTMVNVDASTGTKGSAEPLRTLAQYRLKNGEIHFGTRMRPVLPPNTANSTELGEDEDSDVDSISTASSHWVEQGALVYLPK